MDAHPALRLVDGDLRLAAPGRAARALGRPDHAPARAAVPGHVPVLPAGGRRQGRLADPLPARVLVLRAPRGLHHGAAGVRDHLGGDPRLRAQADLRLQGRRVLDRRDRVLLDARVGAPHVRGRDADLPEHLVHARLDGDRRPDGDEDLQLARDALARQHLARYADAVLPRLPERLHDRRALGDLPRRVPGRLAGDRHVLRRRALPLRAVRRLDDGAARRALLLVAEDVRADAVRAARQVDLPVHLRRLQRDVLPAAPPRPARDAAAHLHVPRRRPLGGLQHDLDDRLVHDGRRLPALPRGDREERQRPPGRQRSLAGGHARVVHDLAAAAAQLRRGALRDERAAAVRPAAQAARGGVGDEDRPRARTAAPARDARSQLRPPPRSS